MSYDLIPKPDQFARDLKRGLDAGGGLPSDSFSVGIVLVIIFIIGAVVKAVMGW
jgi:hypothetical protein